MTAYRTPSLLFKEQPHIQAAKPGIHRDLKGLWVVAQAATSRWRPFKTFYLHTDGLWRTSAWAHERMNGYFESAEKAREARDKISSEIRLYE
ncbi:hypothetical protein FJY93_05170 [Candidatus Kaiserbacteria bacterium]|nr:hypothetical protein [Candidatus Kaiserbacteria bacterium]